MANETNVLSEAEANDLVITNPSPADCEGDEVEPIQFRVVPLPVITSTNPSLICVDQAARNIQLNGQYFLTVDGVLPTVICAIILNF